MARCPQSFVRYVYVILENMEPCRCRYLDTTQNVVPHAYAKNRYPNGGKYLLGQDMINLRQVDA